MVARGDVFSTHLLRRARKEASLVLGRFALRTSELIRAPLYKILLCTVIVKVEIKTLQAL
jgi:hypothetical protein